MSKAKSRSALGINPLSQGIFSKTVPPPAVEPDKFKNQELEIQELQNQESSLLKIDSIEQNQETAELPQPETIQNPEPSQPPRKTGKQNQEKIIKNQESAINKAEISFLNEEAVERGNLRLSVEINDWLDSLLKQGKRTHGRKIPKETWVQAALELFRALPVDWQAIDSEDSLRQALTELESRIKNQ
jgi:vacuolar-type H+-ATPase subunit I/STV1